MAFHIKNNNHDINVTFFRKIMLFLKFFHFFFFILLYKVKGSTATVLPCVLFNSRPVLKSLLQLQNLASSCLYLMCAKLVYGKEQCKSNNNFFNTRKIDLKEETNIIFVISKVDLYIIRLKI